MNHKRLYLDPPLVADRERELDAESSHYLTRVLRARVGDPVLVFDGEGRSAEAEIRHIDRRSTVIAWKQIELDSTSPGLTTILLQGLSRSHKLDLVIQKAAELGVTEIHPISTERSRMRIDELRAESKIDHWKKVVIAACQQCGRNRLPIIHPPTSLIEALPNITADLRLVGSPEADRNLENCAAGLTPNRVAILVGPEGGLSTTEIASAEQSGWTTFRAGPRVMRTETAAIALLAIAQYRWGDLG